MDMAPKKEEKWVQIKVPAGHDLYVYYEDGKRGFKLVPGSSFLVQVRLSDDEVRRRWPIEPLSSPFMPGVCVPGGPALDPRPQPQKDSSPDTRTKADQPKSEHGWCAGDEDFMRNM